MRGLVLVNLGLLTLGTTGVLSAGTITAGHIWHHLTFEDSKPQENMEIVEGKYGKGLRIKQGCITLENKDFDPCRFSVLAWLKP